MDKLFGTGLLSSLASTAFGASQIAYSDNSLNLSSSSSSSTTTGADVEPPKARNDNPRTTAAGFDPAPLEKAVQLLQQIATSSQNKNDKNKVFEIVKKQEEGKQQEFAAKVAEFKAMEKQSELEKQRVAYDEQKKIAQAQAQMKSQMVRYEDELSRKRMQAENEHHRTRNQELVKMQEESSMRQETTRRATEEQIQAQRRQTEREKAEIERETIRVRAMAEAEGRAHEAKLAEDVNKRMLIERANAEREKWVSAIHTTFEHIGGGVKAILTDQNKLVVAVGGVTALAAGIYTTREGAKVIWSYVDRILGQPSLIRESSRGKYPWSGALKRALSSLSHAEKERIWQLASATANTKFHQAPFRNMLFYGPPGTGKTMVARELAKKSGLDYALMTGGDVAPLGAQAVTKIHQLFDWAKKSNRGLLLFIDEADAFLCERNKTYMTVSDRIDEVLEFPLPGEGERFKLLTLYLDKYIAQAGKRKPGMFSQLFQKQQQKIETKGITDEILGEAASKTEGFSGREVAKLMASVQAVVYGSEDCVLDPKLCREVVDYKVAEHQQRRKFAGTDKVSH
ncbi:hypothetical protein LIER_25569 [Lithospermum erythrorhizon]|uniref:AAA+ ATPase domain-containing protein n=1 Tax=Lithospermum erythrorhizon TaxID=34254 RepID=A0AAV3R6P5_LITER